MINLKEYSERELSLVVMNTEDLYNLIHDVPALISKINKSYNYTHKQLEVLIDNVYRIRTDIPYFN